METLTSDRQHHVGKHVSIPSGQINRFDWQELLLNATDPDLEAVISNYREHDISVDDVGISSESPPASITGRLLAVLYNRFLHLNGREDKELIVVNKQLSDDELLQLECVVLELAHLNNLNPAFIDWSEAKIGFSSLW